MTMELEQRVTAAEQKIGELEPDVKANTDWRNKSRILLLGREEDKDDEGIVGMINDMHKTQETLRAWIKAIGTPLIVAILIGIGKMIYEISLLTP